jgi:coenzyme F420 hydrogenase subunit beta
MEKKHFAKDRYRNVEGILKVVQDGLCHRCGACIGFCPVNTFGMDACSFPIKVNECINCNICVQVCSGLAVDYEDIGNRLFDGQYKFGSLSGPVKSACLGHASEPAVRDLGASGGLVTGLLLHLLESGRIKGAIVVVEDPDEPSRGKGIVARTPEALKASAQSRYTTSPHLSALQEIKDEDGPFALVGLPCQIHSLRKRQIVDPRWKQRVPLAIGLLCHYNLPFLVTKESGEMLAPKGHCHVHTQFRQRDERGWPHNTLELTFSDGSKWRSPVGPAQTFNILSRVAPLGRCLTCMDAAAEFSDLSVGDPWIRNEHGRWKYDEPGGWSAVLVRTAAGQGILEEAVRAGRLVLKPIPPEELEGGQHAMMTEKKRRVGFRIRARRLLGRPIPRYTVPLPVPTAGDIGKELRFWFTRLLPAWGPVRRLFIRVGFSPFGLYLVRRRMAQRAKQAAGGKVRLQTSDFGDSVERK